MGLEKQVEIRVCQLLEKCYENGTIGSVSRDDAVGCYERKMAATLRKLLIECPYLEKAFSNEKILTALSSEDLVITKLLSLTKTMLDNVLNLLSSSAAMNAITAVDQVIDECLSPHHLHRDFLWKIIVDGVHEKVGKGVYERNRVSKGSNAERGYMRAMESAFLFMLESIDKKEKLSPDWIRTLHKKAIFLVYHDGRQSTIDEYFVDQGCLPASIRNNIRYELADLQELREYGFIDFSWRSKEFASPLFWDGEPIGLGKNTSDEKLEKWLRGFNREDIELLGRWNAVNQVEKNVEKVLGGLIHEYEENIKKADGDDDKLMAITRFAKQVDTLHPFRDANMRMIILLINRLLIENKLSPVAMMDPNDMDIKASKWMVENQVKPGQERFQGLVLYDSLEKKKISFEQCIEKLLDKKSGSMIRAGAQLHDFLSLQAFNEEQRTRLLKAVNWQHVTLDIGDLHNLITIKYLTEAQRDKIISHHKLENLISNRSDLEFFLTLDVLTEKQRDTIFSTVNEANFKGTDELVLSIKNSDIPKNIRKEIVSDIGIDKIIQKQSKLIEVLLSALYLIEGYRVGNTKTTEDATVETVKKQVPLFPAADRFTTLTPKSFKKLCKMLETCNQESFSGELKNGLKIHEKYKELHAAANPPNLRRR